MMYFHVYTYFNVYLILNLSNIFRIICMSNYKQISVLNSNRNYIITMSFILINVTKFSHTHTYTLLFPFLEINASRRDFVMLFHVNRERESNYKFVVLITCLVLMTGDFVDFVVQFEFQKSRS